MKFALIPPGEFMMGRAESFADMKQDFPYLDQVIADKTIKAYIESEQPQHKVRITRSFYVGIYNVTVGQFGQFVKATGYKTEAERDGTGGGVDLSSGTPVLGTNARYNWKSSEFSQEDDYPVVNVTWNDAIAFCKWLSDKEKAKYRLPTEAEWEYACRAGTTTRYHFGDNPASLVQVANVFDYSFAKKAAHPNLDELDKSYDDGFAFTSPVGRFKPNAFGLYDMHGNAATWCSDWFNPFYYEKTPVDDPKGADTPPLRVVRGGSWIYIPLYARSSYRIAYRPSDPQSHIGFRIVLEVDDP